MKELKMFARIIDVKNFENDIIKYHIMRESSRRQKLFVNQPQQDCKIVEKLKRIS